MKFVKAIALVVVVLLVGAAGYFAWTVSVKDLPAGTYESTAEIDVRPTLYGFAVEPTRDNGRPGLVFLAGAFIAADAYLPFARSLGEAGYPVRVVGLEWGTSMAPGQQARLFGTVSSFMSGPRKWVVGGHSLGSAQAVMFAEKYPTAVAGLFITGSGYPYNDVSMLTVPVVLLGASNDEIANRGDQSVRQGYLPAGATVLSVEGGNHAQFGFYGPQIMDGTATVSHDEQQAQMSAAALALLAEVEAQGEVAQGAAPRNDPRVLPAQFASHYAVSARLGVLDPMAFRQES